MISLPQSLLERLRPHQGPTAEHVLAVTNKHRSVLDGSSTGTGKTFVNAAVASYLREPTLVVCPKVACSTWARAAAHFDDNFSVIGYELLRTGRAPFGWWDNRDPKAEEYLVCENCQCKVIPGGYPCHVRSDGIHSVGKPKKKAIRYGQFNFHPAVQNIIFDEGHRCSGIDSLNSDMMCAARREGRRVSVLSATAAHSPLNMRALGYVLGLHNDKKDLTRKLANGLTYRELPDFKRWAAAYGCRWEQQLGGWKWMVGKDQQLQTMRMLHATLFPEHGVRVSWEDIPGFPERTITAELFDLDDPQKIDSQYGQMREAIERLRKTSQNDKDPEHPLTMILRARQEIELLKVPVFSELAADYRATGHSVVFFVNYRQTIDELAKRFPNARIIDGSPVSVRNRDKWVEEFQCNAARELIVNNEAGGLALSLQDLLGGFPRIGLVSPCFSATTMRQVFGRLHRDGGMSPCFYRVIFINKTIETRVHALVAPKLNNLDALNDGDMEPDNLRLN